jgi:hypothetical protein
MLLQALRLPICRSKWPYKISCMGLNSVAAILLLLPEGLDERNFYSLSQKPLLTIAGA